MIDMFCKSGSTGCSLSVEAYQHIEAIGKAEIMVGIPSYNNVLTVSYVLQQVLSGLVEYFPDRRAVIFVSDGNSVDGTLTSAKMVKLPCRAGVSCNLNLVPAVYLGISGKGSALKAIFEAAKMLDVEAVALVDSDLRSITPEWIKLLLSPALSGTGLVVPYYNRRKYDGTITNFVCYPMTFSLYGKNVRQPIGGDFGLSIELVKEILNSPLWRLPEVHEFGVDIFETHTALAKGFEVKQAFLGVKDHDPKDPTKNLTPMFKQVIGSMFACIEEYESVWKAVHKPMKIEMVGKEQHANSQPCVPIDVQNMIVTYKNNYDQHQTIYNSLLNDLNKSQFKALKNLANSGNSVISFPVETWAKTVYDFTAAFHRAAPAERAALIDALLVLWTGRLAAFIKETWELSPAETEERINDQAQAFLNQKSYLVDIF